MKRAAIYMRVSSERQAQEGDSIPAQRSALRKYIDDRDDMVFIGEYLDDGVSGTRSDRDELQRMLSDVKEGKIAIVLVTKLDRLYRSIRNYLNLQETLDKHHVHWMAIWEPIYDTTTPQGRLIINQMMSIAQFEAENTGQRIRQVFDYKVTKGEVIFGHTPPGLAIKDKHLVHTDMADGVRELFELYDRTSNLSVTTRTFMTRQGFPTTAVGIKQLLQNRLYIGEYRDNSSYCDPIIDKDLFESVQRKLSMNVKVSQKWTYIFNGLVVCPLCGYKMSSGILTQYNRSKTKTYKRPLYRCRRHYAYHNCDNAKYILETTLEKYLLDNIRPQIEQLVLTATIEDVPQRKKDQTASIERRLSRLKELYVNELITLDEYKRDRERILAEMPTEPPKTQQEAIDVDSLKEFLAQPFEAMYGDFTPSEKRYFWRSIIKEIRVSKEKIEVDYV